MESRLQFSDVVNDNKTGVRVLRSYQDELVLAAILDVRDEITGRRPGMGDDTCLDPRAIRDLTRFEVGRERDGHATLANHKRALFYQTGQMIVESGIYEIVQQSNHRGAGDQVALVSGDQFPACHACGKTVSFRLLHGAPYVFHDSDFEQE